MKTVFRLGILLLSLAFSHLASAAGISEEQAARAVRSWLNRSAALGRLPGASVRKATRLADPETGAALHLVTLSGGGFVVTSADDRLAPVLAFSETAQTLRPSADSPLWALLTADVSNRMQAVTAGAQQMTRALSLTENQARWAALLAEDAAAAQRLRSGVSAVPDLRVCPFVDSRWGQGAVGGVDVFNYYTPNHYLCGCVATMLAQMMRYWQWPQNAVAPGVYACFVGTAERNLTMMGGVYDYAQMPLVPTGSLTTAQRAAIGKLTYDIGVSVGMQWTAQGSGATLTAAQLRLAEKFGYANGASVVFTASWPYTLARLKSIVIPNCDARAPVGMGILGPSGGHAVLVDGYGYSESDLYLHLNCGWDGFDDAWYCPPAIETSSYSFTAIHTLIFNIFPQQTGSLCTGRVLSPAGRPLARASVSLKTWRGVVRSVETDEQGIYAFVAAPGTYTLEASAPSLRASASVTVAKTTGTRLLAGGYGEYYAYPDPSIGNVYGQELVMREVAPPQTSATPVAVPYAWLETHYPTPGQTEQGYERLALADTDGDGFPAWQEYAANTDPTDARSKLLCEISLLTDGTPVVTVRPETAREGYPRQLQGKTSLNAASWVDLAAPSRLYRFYRVTVPAASAVR